MVSSYTHLVFIALIVSYVYKQIELESPWEEVSDNIHSDKPVWSDCHSFDDILNKISTIQSMTNVDNDEHERYIRNLYITDTYGEFLFNDNEHKLSNWMSIGVWASKMVGQHIRKYSAYYYLKSVFGSKFKLPTFYKFLSSILNYFMSSQIEITSSALSDGNLMVFNDIAMYSALLGQSFCNLTDTNIGFKKDLMNRLNKYKSYFSSDNYLLYEAYKHYIYVKYHKVFNLNKLQIQQYMIYANLLIGYFEQQKLQIPLDNAVSDWFIDFIPYFNISITQYISEIITKHLFELCVGDTCHWLANNIDIYSNTNIKHFLNNINYIPLKNLLMKFYPHSDGINIDIDAIFNKNAASNWLNLDDRMQYVTALFLYHINDTYRNHDIFTNNQKNMIWNECQIPDESEL